MTKNVMEILVHCIYINGSKLHLLNNSKIGDYIELETKPRIPCTNYCQMQLDLLLTLTYTYKLLNQGFLVF